MTAGVLKRWCHGPDVSKEQEEDAASSGAEEAAAVSCLNPVSLRLCDGGGSSEQADVTSVWASMRSFHCSHISVHWCVWWDLNHGAKCSALIVRIRFFASKNWNKLTWKTTPPPYSPGNTVIMCNCCIHSTFCGWDLLYVHVLLSFWGQLKSKQSFPGVFILWKSLSSSYFQARWETCVQKPSRDSILEKMLWLLLSCMKLRTR